MYKLTIETNKIKSYYHDKWNGNGTFKRYLNTKEVKKEVEEKLITIVGAENIENINVRLNDNVIIINTKELNNQTVFNIVDKLIKRDIIASVS